MDPLDTYFGTKLKNMAGMHRTPANGKMRLLQAARQVNETAKEYYDHKIVVYRRLFELNNSYNLFNRPEDNVNLYSFQWGLTNLRLIL